tara:strand:- start:2703 stop:3032 length:330 start_codon:yes stop_codon:yes gene_type:complete
MDSKVVSTLALLVGVLAALYILTGMKEERPVHTETETVSVQESSEEQDMSKTASEHVHSAEESPRGEELPNVEESPRGEESPNVEESEELKLSKQYNVTGYGGTDYSTF